MGPKVQATKDISRSKKIYGFILDETVIKVGSEYIWLWVAIEPKNMEILALNISKERNAFVVEERFIAGSTFMENI